MENYFTSNLKFVREKRGLSQSKLAEIINVNQTTIARWEDENRTPTIEKAIDVSNALNIPLDDLIGIDLRIKENNNIFNQYAVLFDKYKDLSDEDKELIANIIETRKKQIDKELGED